MKLAYITDSLGSLPFETMLQKVQGMGVEYLEMTTGGWSPAPHLNLDELLDHPDKLVEFKAMLEKYHMKLIALNCSGNPLDPGPMGKEHRRVIKRTFELAEKLNVKKIITMSGLPAAAPGDQIPNWITTTVSWPASLQDALKYQWEDVAIPYWQATVKDAKAHGIEKIALENFSSQLVYNPETLLKLRDAVDPMIGMNLDPSHLIWMGADPIACARKLGPAIHHVHGKDVRIERGMVDTRTVLETKPIDDIQNRAWNYVAVGCGQDLQWWKEFFSVVRMTGYNDFVSLEMEDLSMSPEAGVQTSIDALQHTLSF